MFGRCFFDGKTINKSLTSSYYPQSNGHAEWAATCRSIAIRSSRDGLNMHRTPLTRHSWATIHSNGPGLPTADPMVGRALRRTSHHDGWFRHSQEVWEGAHVWLQIAIWQQGKLPSSPPPTVPMWPSCLVIHNEPRSETAMQKLNTRFIGPFCIIHQMNSVSYCL